MGQKYKAGYIQMSFIYTDEVAQRWCKVINIVVEIDQLASKKIGSLDPYTFLLGLVL